MRCVRVSLVASLFVPLPVMAQCLLCAHDPHAAATPSASVKPLDIEIETALDFSRVAQVSGAGGQVIVDPATGMRRVTGSLTDLGGGVLRGHVRVSGEPLRPIRVILPERITLYAGDGSAVTVTNIRTTLPPNPILPREGTLTFDFGGQLNVGTAAAGNYHGRVPITVEYL